MKATAFGMVLSVLAGGSLAGAQGVTLYNTIVNDFNEAGDMTHVTDPVNAGETIGLRTSANDSPAYSPEPFTAPGANGTTSVLQLGNGGAGTFGVAIGVWDIVAAGHVTEAPTNYTVEADVFVVVHATHRHQQGIGGRWANSGNSPLELFHSDNTPGNPDGYGYRSGGATTTYGDFTAETSNRWVHMKLVFEGATVTGSVDRDMDGNPEYTETGISATERAGVPIVFSVLNDPGNGSSEIANQFSYFDNLSVTIPTVTAAEDWALYQ